MIRKLNIAMMMVLAFAFFACKQEVKTDKQKLVQEKLTELSKLKADQQKLTEKINALQDEIFQLDPSQNPTKTKLVKTKPIEIDTFKHYINLQGKVDAENVAFVAPKGMGGVVKQIFVKVGSKVSKGQAILKLDDAIASQTVQTAKGQVNTIQAQLNLAQSVLQRQQNLWKENIGTELQVMNAKTNVETLQSQLNSAQSQLAAAQTALGYSTVRAEISGTINTLNVKVGEMFGAGQQIQIVNNSQLKMVINVPENYLTKVKQGTSVQLTFPDAGDKKLYTKVNVVSNFIDPTSRSFYVESKLPYDKSFYPNQLAAADILDYQNNKAIVVPATTIQNDEAGKYILVAQKSADGKMIAKKARVEIGEIYGDNIEVLKGLQAGDVIITDGMMGLFDGQAIRIE